MHRENKGERGEADAVKRDNVADRNQYLSPRNICWELGRNLIVAAGIHQSDPNHSRSSVSCTFLLTYGRIRQDLVQVTLRQNAWLAVCCEENTHG